MKTNTLKIVTRFVTDLCRSFYSTFYSAGSGWFIATVSIAVCLFFASSSGNPAIINAFNLIILPWQISFLIYVLGAVRSFFAEKWSAAKRSIDE